MQKKGDVWISAVLYFGIGIVIITILLTAGLPVINRLRDKNVVIQTKQVMHTLDENIREVIKEGPGSQRVVTINIKKGVVEIDAELDEIKWVFDGANILISEPKIDVEEGKIIIRTEEGAEGGTYDISIISRYTDLNVDLTRGTGDVGGIIGIGDLVIRNNGVDPSIPGKVQISVSLANA